MTCADFQDSRRREKYFHVFSVPTKHGKKSLGLVTIFTLLEGIAARMHKQLREKSRGIDKWRSGFGWQRLHPFDGVFVVYGGSVGEERKRKKNVKSGTMKAQVEWEKICLAHITLFRGGPRPGVQKGAAWNKVSLHTFSANFTAAQKINDLMSFQREKRKKLLHSNLWSDINVFHCKAHVKRLSSVPRI